MIDQAVNPLPAGFKGLIVGYQDDSVTVYKTYGVVFAIGSATKTFTGTLLALANLNRFRAPTTAAPRPPET